MHWWVPLFHRVVRLQQRKAVNEHYMYNHINHFSFVLATLSCHHHNFDACHGLKMGTASVAKIR